MLGVKRHDGFSGLCVGGLRVLFRDWLRVCVVATDQRWRELGLPEMADFDRAGYWQGAVDIIRRAKERWHEAQAPQVTNQP